jgi:hypothetical protein
MTSLAQLPGVTRWTLVHVHSDESGGEEVYVQSFPKPGNKKPISIVGGKWPKWSRDSREIYYLSLDWKQMAASVTYPGSGIEFSVPRPHFSAPLTSDDPARDQVRPCLRRTLPL